MAVTESGMTKLNNGCWVDRGVVSAVWWQWFPEESCCVFSNADGLVDSNSPHSGILKQFFVAPGRVCHLQLQGLSVMLAAPDLVKSDERRVLVHTDITGTDEGVVAKGVGSTQGLFIPDVIELPILEG